MMLLIIAARIGSKRIPRKNVKDFKGRPIISYSLDLAKKLTFIDKIHVSTESKLISAVAEAEGIQTDFYRTKDLADDFSTTIDVYKFVLQEYVQRGFSFSSICVLSSCAPLLDMESIEKAFRLFKKQKFQNPVVAVTECDSSNEHSFSISKFIEYKRKSSLLSRSQDLTKKYKHSGAFAFFPASVVLNPGSDGFFSNVIPFEVSKLEHVDIDEHEDWYLAEALFEKKCPSWIK
jgi:pseudaminic acid cytidylyltransferase